MRPSQLKDLLCMLLGDFSARTGRDDVVCSIGNSFIQTDFNNAISITSKE